MAKSDATDLNTPLLILVPLFRLLTLPLRSDLGCLTEESMARLVVKRGDSATKDLPLTDGVCSRSIRLVLNPVLSMRYVLLWIDRWEAASILRVQKHVWGAQGLWSNLRKLALLSDFLDRVELIFLLFLMFIRIIKLFNDFFDVLVVLLDLLCHLFLVLVCQARRSQNVLDSLELLLWEYKLLLTAFLYLLIDLPLNVSKFEKLGVLSLYRIDVSCVLELPVLNLRF